jgi:protein O-mannosyl-transferase
MAKPMAVTFPLTLLILDVWPLRRFSPGIGTAGGTGVQGGGRAALRLLMEKVPLLAVSAGPSMLAIHAEEVIGALPPSGSLTWR